MHLANKKENYFIYRLVIQQKRKTFKFLSFTKIMAYVIIHKLLNCVLLSIPYQQNNRKTMALIYISLKEIYSLPLTERLCIYCITSLTCEI